jgi:hypothetical protein
MKNGTEKTKLAVAARNKKMLSKYNWIIAEPYYDIIIDNGSTGKSKKFITLREFKERIDDGQTLKMMKDEGISKHLIGFFGNFLKGKITLTKSDFEKRYSEGKELDDIGEEFGVQRGDLSYLRQLYGIKRKGATYIHRKKTEVPLTQIQKDLIYGSMMGDAKRQSTKFNSSVGFGQGGEQMEFLAWKYSLLENIASPNGIKKYSQYDERYGKEYDSWRFYTSANSDVEEILNKFYGPEGKQITREILSNISVFSLAVWFMDDGYTDWQHRKRKQGINSTPEVKICTDSYSLESCQNIIDWFKEEFDLNAHIREHRPGQNRIIFNSDSAYEFLDLIYPHMIPSMLYKVDYQAYLSDIRNGLTMARNEAKIDCKIDADF